MKFREYLREQEKSTATKNTGLYVAVQFNESAKDDIQEFIKKYNIPNGIDREDAHCTLIYSRTYDDVTINDNMEDEEIIAYPKELHTFDTDNGKCLVIKLTSDYIENRQKELMKDYNLTYDYDEYIPHITLANDIGEFKIPDDIEFPKFFRIISEYKEALDLNK